MNSKKYFSNCTNIYCTENYNNSEQLNFSWPVAWHDDHISIYMPFRCCSVKLVHFYHYYVSKLIRIIGIWYTAFGCSLSGSFGGTRHWKSLVRLMDDVKIYTFLDCQADLSLEIYQIFLFTFRNVGLVFLRLRRKIEFLSRYRCKNQYVLYSNYEIKLIQVIFWTKWTFVHIGCYLALHSPLFINSIVRSDNLCIGILWLAMVKLNSYFWYILGA